LQSCKRKVVAVAPLPVNEGFLVLTALQQWQICIPIPSNDLLQSSGI